MNVLCFLSVITHAIKYWYFCNKYFQWNIYSHKIFYQIFRFSRAFLEYIHHEHSPRFSQLSVNENVDPFLAWVSQCWQVKKWFTLISLLPDSLRHLLLFFNTVLWCYALFAFGRGIECNRNCNHHDIIGNFSCHYPEHNMIA